MYKGIVLKNSDRPRYLNPETRIKYKTIGSSEAPIPPNRVVRISYDRFPEELGNPEEFFAPGASFLYHDTVIFSPIEPGLKKDLQYMEHPTYEFYDRFNYHSEVYNDFVSDLSELECPNFYLSKTVDDNDRYKDIFAFNSDITSKQIFNSKNSLINRYNSREPEDINRMSNIFLSKTAKRYSESEKRYFPYAVDIKLNFRDVDIMSSLLDQYDIHKSSLSLIESIPKEPVQFQITQKNIDEESVSGGQVFVSSIEDLLDFAYFPKDGGLVYLPDTTVRSRYSENLVKIEARKDFNKIALENTPSLDAILNNQKVTNEILYIKMEKYAGAVADGNLVQNIWLRDSSIINNETPEKSKFGIYDYYDTQVKLGQTYTYIIKAYVLIYGAQITCLGADENTAEFEILPSFKIAEVELTRKTITVLPPIQLPPLVHPYCDNIKNKVFFHMHLVQGREFMDYKVFRNQDEQYRTKILDTSQYEKPEHAFISEKGIFEVFRLEHEPKSLNEFSNSKIAEVSRESLSTSAIFSENIIFNKDYYYVFRALNFLKYPSNPTKIYKINLQKTVEGNILSVERFEITEEEHNYSNEKKFTKLIHINPNVRDYFLDESQTQNLDSYLNNIDKVKMGLNENFSAWGNTYKIRIKSNNTGKKIDINVKFKLTREQ